jgi:hypothetical protein
MKSVATVFLILWTLAFVFFVGRYYVRMHVRDKANDMTSTVECRTFWQLRTLWSNEFIGQGIHVHYAATDKSPEIMLTADCY